MLCNQYTCHSLKFIHDYAAGKVIAHFEIITDLRCANIMSVHIAMVKITNILSTKLPTCMALDICGYS